MEVLGNRVLVRPIEEEEGLIITPDSAKAKPTKGEIVGVGDGFLHHGQLIPIRLSIGQVIYYSKYGGSEIKLADEKLLVIDMESVYLAL